MTNFPRSSFTAAALPSFLDEAVWVGAGLVSCEDNPRDLRPAVAEITDRVERVSARLRPGQPLVILMGEIHTMQIHSVLPMMVLERLVMEMRSRKGGSIACGIEREHNFLGRMLNRKLGYKLPAAQLAQISAADHNGQRSLETLLAFESSELAASVAHHTTLNFCRLNNLPICFADVARRWEAAACFLDSDDPGTRSLMTQRISGWAGEPISAEAPEGVRVRNIWTVERSMAHIEKTGAQRYAYMCGRAHLFGVRSKTPYQDSLHAMFTRAGAAVLSVFPTHTYEGGGAETIPVGADPALRDSVIITLMDDEEFYWSMPGAPAFVRDVLAQSGAEDFPVFDVEDPNNDDRIRLGQYVREHARYWVVAP